MKSRLSRTRVVGEAFARHGGDLFDVLSVDHLRQPGRTPRRGVARTRCDFVARSMRVPMPYWLLMQTNSTGRLPQGGHDSSLSYSTPCCIAPSPKNATEMASFPSRAIARGRRRPHAGCRRRRWRWRPDGPAPCRRCASSHPCRGNSRQSLAADLGHHPVRVRAAGKEDAVPAMMRGEAVLRPQRGADAGRRPLLADRQMQHRAGGQPAHVQLGHPLLEAADAPHGAVQLRQAGCSARLIAAPSGPGSGRRISAIDRIVLRGALRVRLDAPADAHHRRDAVVDAGEVAGAVGGQHRTAQRWRLRHLRHHDRAGWRCRRGSAATVPSGWHRRPS